LTKQTDKLSDIERMACSCDLLYGVTCSIHDVMFKLRQEIRAILDDSISAEMRLNALRKLLLRDNLL